MKIQYNILSLILLFVALALFSGCAQSDPPAPTEEFGRDGDIVTFSGIDWLVKGNGQLQGPGPNYFSKREEDIFLDDNGFLHMRIAKDGDTWYSTEVVTIDTMGYGTYTFTVDGDFQGLPNNVVVGLFTWDTNTFYEQANSEVDIEFSKWGGSFDETVLQYGVQPIAFSDYFAERVHEVSGSKELMNGVSTHSFLWTDEFIEWKSYSGNSAIEANLQFEWTFDLNNPPRVKEEGNSASLPIIIPAPGSTTNARINFWILPWVGFSDESPLEIIIRRFEYDPL